MRPVPPPPARDAAPAPADVAWQRALRLLAARDRTTAEIRARLDAHGIAPEHVAATVRRLLDLQYLDDARYAHDAAATAARRGYGSERARTDLIAKGIDTPLAATAVAAAFADEPALARQALTRRFPNPPHDARARARAARFLLGRGFSDDVVLAILGEGCY